MIAIALPAVGFGADGLSGARHRAVLERRDRARPDALQRTGSPRCRDRCSPGAPHARQGWRWSSRHATLTTRRGPCSDGMSDRLYAEHVTLRWQGRLLTGCGGGVVAGDG
ncbi:hypothetical protein AB5I41_04910 [Sphingomonas sp. MMS24-JH45]